MKREGAGEIGRSAGPPDGLDGRFDVAGVGAGPAGALASRQLGLAGLSVALIDKAAFPRDKVCGCCLNAAALTTLSDAGLGGLVGRLGADPIARLELAMPRARASLRVRGVALSRAAFDLGLVRGSIAAGVRFMPQTIASIDAAGVLHVRPTGGDQPRMIEARVIVIADGLAGSALAARPDLVPRIVPNGRIGASTILPASTAGYERGAIHMAIGRGGYVGAVRLEDQRLNVAAALDPGFIRDRGGPGPSIMALLREAGMPTIRGLADARFHATPALTRRRSQLESDRVLIMGDAAGYVEPFTGEGIAWALASAAAIVSAVLARCSTPGVPPRSWSRVYRRCIAPRQQVCRAIAGILRRPALATAIVRILAVSPGLARPVLGRMALPYAAPEPAP